MISVVLLAAGLSERMGIQNKLLLPLGSTTLVEQTIAQYIKSDLDEIIVVVGYNEKEVRKRLKGYKNLKVILNPNYEKGMTTSIQTGISNVNSNVIGYMIGFTDMPFITPNQINLLVKEFKINYNNNHKLIVVPSFKNNESHPIIFSSYYKQDILSHMNKSGLRDIKTKYRANVMPIEMETEEFMFDIDTESDYNKFRNIF